MGIKRGGVSVWSATVIFVISISLFLSCASARRESLSDLVLKAFRISVWFAIKSNSYCVRSYVRNHLSFHLKYHSFETTLYRTVQNIVSITPPDRNNNASKFRLSTQAPVRLVLLELSVIIRMIFGETVFPSINLFPGNVVFNTTALEIAWRGGISDQYPCIRATIDVIPRQDFIPNFQTMNVSTIH